VRLSKLPRRKKLAAKKTKPKEKCSNREGDFNRKQKVSKEPQG